MTASTIEGPAYPLGLDHVDTDLIIVAEHLKTLSREGLGAHAFEGLRQAKPNVFDDPRYQGASILIAGENFGCGSSREHAVWALMDMGIKAVVAASYSDIFAGNALKNGLAAIVVGPRLLSHVLAHARSGAVSIDLAEKTIATGDAIFTFEMDEAKRQRLLSGLDEIGMTLAMDEVISLCERQRGPMTPEPL